MAHNGTFYNSEQFAEMYQDMTERQLATLEPPAAYRRSQETDWEWRAAELKEHSIKFALQYVGLHDVLNPGDDRLFRIKPKLHFFLHLCSDGGNPAMHWCYRDEDFGGSVAKAARRRGGMRKPSSTSMRVLTLLKISNPRISVR